MTQMTKLTFQRRSDQFSYVQVDSSFDEVSIITWAMPYSCEHQLAPQLGARGFATE